MHKMFEQHLTPVLADQQILRGSKAVKAGDERQEEALNRVINSGRLRAIAWITDSKVFCDSSCMTVFSRASARFRPPISWAILEAPTTFPSAFLIGDTVSRLSINLPSFDGARFRL